MTGTGISAARLYWENRLVFFRPTNVPLPTAVSVFPDEIYAVPACWTRRAYPDLVYFNKLDRGGHFAAWEQPGLFAAELRAAFAAQR